MNDVSAGALASFANAMCVLFVGLCEIETMKVANQERESNGFAPAYRDTDFYQVQQSTVGRFHDQIAHCL